MSIFSTYTVALVSTAHLRPETLEVLSDWAGPDSYPRQPMTLAQDIFGFWIWSGYHEHEDVPGELREILRRVQAQGCEYLRLDRDQVPADTLPIFEESCAGAAPKPQDCG